MPHPKRPNKASSLFYFLALVLVVCLSVYLGSYNGSETPPSVTPYPTEYQAATPISGSYYQIYFTDPKNPELHIENRLIALIDESTSSIDGAVYEFNLENVAQALIRAKDRGVNVRMVYDPSATNEDPQIDELKSAGIPLTAYSGSAIMHNKFFVIDQKIVWTGSFNLSNNAALKNNENAVAFYIPELAQNYENEFTKLFNGQFGHDKASNTPHPIINFGEVKIENYFSPQDGIADYLINLVSSSTKSVHFMAFSFTLDGLGYAMLDDVERGIEVMGIFETRQIGLGTECGALLDKASIRLDGNPYTFHHKIIIIDESIVVFGSYNFSANAEDSNDENLLIVYDPVFAASFEEEFQARWAEGKTPPPNCGLN